MQLDPARTTLAPLLKTVRAALDRRIPWSALADDLAHEVAPLLPAPGDVLTAEQQLGDPHRCHSFPIHVEPDGCFSVVAFIARPGQATTIHDHVTWGVTGVVQGIEDEERFTVAADGAALVPAGRYENRIGEVSAFAPPGDIHRIRAAGPDVAISIHVYGTDISRLRSSVRRTYDLPVV